MILDDRLFVAGSILMMIACQVGDVKCRVTSIAKKTFP